MTDSITLQPVGYVRSPYSERGDRDWAGVVSEIHIDPALAPGLLGIEDYSHIVVIFYLHKSHFDPDRDMIRRPMDRADLPLRGFFALRTNYRPSYFALTTVELLRMADNVLTVRGLDALDGSPVLDIKPFVPHFDHPEAVRQPAWIAQLHEEQQEARTEPDPPA